MDSEIWNFIDFVIGNMLSEGMQPDSLSWCGMRILQDEVCYAEEYGTRRFRLRSPYLITSQRNYIGHVIGRGVWLI
jgi:hypothetical protein